MKKLHKYAAEVIVFLVVVIIGSVGYYYNFHGTHVNVCIIALHPNNSTYYMYGDEIKGVYDSYNLKHGQPAAREQEENFLNSIRYIECEYTANSDIKNMNITNFRELYPDYLSPPFIVGP